MGPGEGLGSKPAQVPADRAPPCDHAQNTCVNTQYSEPDSSMAAGRVSTQAMARLRRVAICRPERLAAMVPATPEESTWVVETGRPYMSAAPMVSMATTSAEAPWA